ncbi:hypothetical protein P153DRAFT_335387 [Dothidotthia symphoricarpi CBS 119687]|uniref:DUF7779 domain-containing protein n=1 Tax=Dothidotthia symphoricarpi CBS 119687 TaxID=1392245 RepID=A0A6A6AKH1_9PLEO|nr:uncharacterized protein P153DRAFT_335387 [Dothidotthia symphoricarpi CBS 119687]KAF2132449.1 hypothetical protein P153DRAFT_335387 [Dothidotthia symphoricarpi CBS 119687]
MASASTFGHRNAGFQAGIVNGPVNTTFQLSPERPETPPHPTILISFPRDVDFVERESILDQVHEKCAVSGERTALIGLGGVGKSQLAIEYAYRTHKRSPETWVFWVYASNAARFEESFRDIAECAKIAGRHDPQKDVLKLVHNWLRHCKERWLVILDNVDDVGSLLDVRANDTGQQAGGSGSTSNSLLRHIPHSEHGSVLVTSRNKEAALKVVEQRNIVTVGPFDKAQAQALLEKKLGVQGHDRDIAELAAALEYMPLAIVQAASYISQRAPLCSAREYLEKFQNSDREGTGLLDYEGGQLRRDRDAKNSIFIAWQISFEHIQRTRPSAAELLSLMSFFDRQGIPETLIRSRGVKRISTKQRLRYLFHLDKSHRKSQDDCKAIASDSDSFEEDVMTLRNFCFISVEANMHTFEMHRLVQRATRKWLEANSKIEQWKQQFIKILCAEFPKNGHYENWPTCQALYAHVKSAADLRPETKSSLLDWAELLYRAASYANGKKNIADAEALALKSLEVHTQILGQEHKHTLCSMNAVGLAYNLRVDHLETLRSMSNLAATYSGQGRWDAAEELEVQVLEARRKKPGTDHPDTLINMNNLASTWKSQGRDAEAICLMRECVQLKQQVLGADHPDFMNSSTFLARWEADRDRAISVP